MLKYEEKPISAEIIKGIFRNEDMLKTFVVDYFNKHLQEMNEGGEHSKITISTYRQPRDKTALFLEFVKDSKNYPRCLSVKCC